MSNRVLMCPPEYFDVVDVKNDFMRSNVGGVDRALAGVQWQALREAFERNGIAVELVPAVPGCEDMVFTANPAFNGRRANGEPVCVPSRMAFPSRYREVDAHREWFASRGYTIVELPPDVTRCEGGGDAVWHPGRSLIWAAVGQRTERRAHDALAAIFGVQVLSLDLADPRFYHLDTCFCALDERTALIYPGGFTEDGLRLIRGMFDDVIVVEEEEARGSFTCNAAAFEGGIVVLQRGAPRAAEQLRERGYTVVEVETGEFMKSGGSVFCMKAALC